MYSLIFLLFDINASGNLAVDKLLYPRNGKLVTLLDEAVSTR
mgnify:CR=1 FL=1